LEQLAFVCVRHPNVHAYVFGSAMRGKQQPNDIDVLLIYERQDDRRALVHDMRGMNLSTPLHVISMTPEEQEHYDFIRGQDARLIQKPPLVSTAPQLDLFG
jgi:hypothetical protein